MRFALPAKGTRLIQTTGMVALLCVSLVGSLFLGVSSPHASALAAPGQQQATVYTSATKGTIAPFGVANLQNATAATAHVATTSTIKQFPKGSRHIPNTSQVATTHGSVNANSHGMRVGTLLQNFNGASSLDSENTNFGAEFEPPDQGLCVGNGFVIDPVNSTFTIYRTNGSPVLGPLNVNVLFDEGLTQFTSDPRCYFDKSTNTWVATILFIGTDANGNFINEGRTDVAVNTTGNPTTPWTVYHLEANDDGTGGMPNHAGCPCFGDQPLLGIDQQNIYVSTNEFSILGPAFNGAQIYAISKDQLFDLSHAVKFVHFDNLNIGGSTAASVQPSSTHNGAEAEFFMNSLDPQGTTDNRIGVWALTNRDEVSEGGLPTLSSTVLTSEMYGVPPNAIQQGNASLLNAGDDRMQQTQFIDGNLWGALNTTITIANDSAARAGIAWFQVHPSIHRGVIGNSTEIAHQGYVASSGNYLLYPAIQATPDGNVAVVFAFSGPNNFPSAAYAVMREGQHEFGAITIAAAGTGSYVNGTRWGDYSYAALDPDSNRLWFATEYVPPVSSQTTDGSRNWGTRVIEIDGRS